MHELPRQPRVSTDERLTTGDVHERLTIGDATRELQSGPLASALPAHRVAARAALLAGTAGPFIGLCTLAALALTGERIRAREVPEFLGATSLATGVALALLVIAEELARRLRPALRMVAIIAAGASSGLVMTVAIAWAVAIVNGRGLEGALSEVARIADAIAARPAKPLLAAGCVLLMVLGLGAPRLGALPGRAGWVPPLPLQVLLAAGAGLAGLLLFRVGVGGPMSPKERVLLPLLFALVPASASLGLWLGERLEARLLAAWRRWREAE